MCGFESERGKLKFDAPLNWQPVEFSKCVDQRQIRWLLCDNFCCYILDRLQTSEIFTIVISLLWPNNDDNILT